METAARCIKMIGMLISICAAIWLFSGGIAAAHCDTLDGPVVSTARVALEKGDVTPVLKWVKKEDEEEIRQAFDRAVNVRAKGPAARELADMYFFETLVRIHRAGEGAPYTGLKPEKTVDPAIAAADKALESGNAEKLIAELTKRMASGIRERFQLALERKKHADQSVETGREFVEAYVEYVHYVERLHTDVTGRTLHHGDPVKAGSKLHEH